MRWLPPDPGEAQSSPHASIVALIKPQFEAGKRDAARGKGVIRDADVHKQVLLDILAFADSHDLRVRGLQRSPLLGPKGNAEFLAWLGTTGAAKDIRGLVEGAVSARGRVQN
jgi:23S rRNA (cytidine1920-2'-O)/16S rRNA (cytidine1409-2'-O)-methyltransferase